MREGFQQQELHRESGEEMQRLRGIRATTEAAFERQQHEDLQQTRSGSQHVEDW